MTSTMQDLDVVCQYVCRDVDGPSAQLRVTGVWSRCVVALRDLEGVVGNV